MTPLPEPPPRPPADGFEPLEPGGDPDALLGAEVSHLRAGDREYVVAFRNGLAPGRDRKDLRTVAVRGERGLRVQCDVADGCRLQLSIGRDRLEVALRDHDLDRLVLARKLLGGLDVRWRPAERIAANGTAGATPGVVLRGTMPCPGKRHRLTGFTRVAALLPSLAEFVEARAHLGSLFDRPTVAALLPALARRGVLVTPWIALGGAARVRNALRPLLLEPLDATGELGRSGALRFARRLLALTPSLLGAADETAVDSRIREVFLASQARGRRGAAEALRAAAVALAELAADPSDAQKARTAELAGRRLRSVGRGRGGGRGTLLAGLHLDEARRALVALGDAPGTAWRPRLAWEAREIVKATALASAPLDGERVHERIARSFRTVREEEAAVLRQTASRRRGVLAGAASVTEAVEESRVLDRAEQAAERLRVAAEEIRELVRDRLADGRLP